MLLLGKVVDRDDRDQQDSDGEQNPGDRHVRCSRVPAAQF